jgi:uncharacterized protein (DUF983 family)
MTNQPPVSLAKAVCRGFLGRCPHCGEGRLFPRFLKVAHHCEACGEELFHQRADDFPAYLVIVLVGHAVVPAILAVEMAYAPPLALQLAIWLPVTLIASLALLQPVKGAIVGLQWQTGMHGFAGAGQDFRENGWTGKSVAADDARIVAPAYRYAVTSPASSDAGNPR